MESPLAPPVAEMGPAARLSNVLFTPSKVFESVARKPGWDWLVPVALLLVILFVGSALTTSKLDLDAAVSQQMKVMEKRQPGMSEEQKEKIETAIRGQMKFFTSTPGRLVSMLFLLVPIFVVPAFYHGIALAFGKGIRYMTVVAGYAYAQIPMLLYWVLSVVVTLPRDKIDVEDAQLYRLVKSNVGAFLDPETTNRALLALATSLDIFSIWGLVLTAIMVSKTTKFTLKGAFAVVGGLWGIWVLIQMALGALQSAFAG